MSEGPCRRLTLAEGCARIVTGDAEGADRFPVWRTLVSELTCGTPNHSQLCSSHTASRTSLSPPKPIHACACVHVSNAPSRRGRHVR